MNWDQIEGKWKQVRGSAKQQWGKFTDDDLEYIAGQRDQLIGKLQERYGYAREEAQKRAEEWMKSLPAADQSMKGNSMKDQKAPSGPPPHAPQREYHETAKHR